MWLEYHPSTSHRTTVAEPRLGVWSAYDSNSEEGWRGKLAVFWGYVIIHFEKWKMDYDFFIQPDKTNTMSNQLIECVECS